MQASMMKTIISFTKQYSPEILSGLAIGGVIGTAILAVKATPRAINALDEASIEKNKELKPDDKSLEWQALTKREVFECTWKYYVPAALSGAGTIACIIGATRLGSRRNAALIAGMALADRAFQDYKDEVKEILGERKELEVREKIAQKQIDEQPPSKEVIILDGTEQLCFDTFTGRTFRSDVETIRRAENEINARIIRDMWCPHNEFYDLVGLPHVIAGEEMGWNMDHLMELFFTSHLGEDGKTYLAIGYRKLPKADYGKVF